MTRAQETGGGTASSFPRSVYLYIAGLYGLTGAATAFLLTLPDTRSGLRIGHALPSLVVLTAAAYFVLRYRYRDNVYALDLFEAAVTPALLAAPGITAMLLVAGALATSNTLRRNNPVKAAFNIAQGMLSTALGSIVFVSLRNSGDLTAHNVGSLLLAMAVIFTINHASIAIVIGLSQGRPARRVVVELAPVILPGWITGWAVNTSFGLMFATAFDWHPSSLLLALVPLATLHWAFRAYATAAADQARLRGLQRATHALVKPVDPGDAIHDFLAEVRVCFEAEAVELVLVEEGQRHVHHVDEDGRYSTRTEDESRKTFAAASAARPETVRVDAHHGDSELRSLLRAEGRRDSLAAPLIEENSVLGVLCVYNCGGLEAFRSGEAAVLEALAREAAAAIHKSKLLSAVFEERRKLSEIVTQTSDGILTMDPDGVLLMWSPGLERISGYRPDEMIGKRNLDRLQPRDAEGAPVTLELWPGETELPADVQIIARDGHAVWLSCSYSPVLDAEGKPRILIVVARDATEQREVERLKDDFVATVSHELRTPLTPLKAWANTLLHVGNRLDEEQRREGLQTMLRQADRLERLITNLLEVSKIERGIGERQEGIVDARNAVSKVVEEARTAHPKRAIKLSVGSGRFRACGDELWIEQIVSNLLSNAVKYSPSDKPIEVVIRETPGLVTVEVRDHGPGIPANQTEKIFNRFHRMGDHLTRAQGGAGLGLYIARQLAHAIGATLTVQSEVGSGATFVLTLRATNQLAIVL